MIPALIPLPGSPWDVLPPGVHKATLAEVKASFAHNARRRELFAGFLSAIASLRGAGCREVLLDGSYVTAKPMPGDYDACWSPAGVIPSKLDPVFRDFTNKRAAQKAKFKGEFFPSTATTLSKSTGTHTTQAFSAFFQIDRFTGSKKGILSIDILNDPMLKSSATP